MVITFTMNPAVDRTMFIHDFLPGGVNRVISSRVDAGGNGVNVCRALKILGTECVTSGFIAGQNGRFIKDYLSSVGITYDFIEVPGETRVNLKIVDHNGISTDFNEAGFEIADADFSRLGQRLSYYIRHDNIIVLCGSTTPHFPVEKYGELCQIASSRDTQLIVDTTGQYLLESLKYKPLFIKPNIMELSEALGRDIKSQETLCASAREMLKMGAQNIAVSMGAEGALFMSSEQTVFVKAPEVPVHGPVGAGDVMVAGIVHGLINRMDFANLARFASAVAVSSVTVEGTGMGSRREVLKYYEQIEALYL